jgi:HD-like signal output (HDOD) protein
MKSRCELSASEVADLHDELERKLEAVGVETQPGVALRILDLTQNPDAGMADYAGIIRNDPGLTGRLIRLSNSAFFAQRKPVTNIDRACVLLGTSRLRSIALGFYLSRAASTDRHAVIGRQVWGQSVYRACLAAEIARTSAPSHASEAFVIGLMLDAGIPLLSKLLGAEHDTILARGLDPTRTYLAEQSELPFTHLDVISVLMRRWKFPDLLAKPINWHHTPPPTGAPPCEPVHALYRVAFFAGAVKLDKDGRPVGCAVSSADARAQFGIDPTRLEAIAERSTQEFSAVVDLFSDVADRIEVPNLAEQVHAQLIRTIDDNMARGLGDPLVNGAQQFRLGGLRVTVRPDDSGTGTAYSYDSRGEPMSSYRFDFAGETPGSIRAALGLEADEGDDVAALGEYLRRLAA